MAATIIADTLKFTRRLTEAGMNEAQAEALADAINEHGTTPASKEDVQLLRADMETRFARLELRLFAGQLAVGAALLGVMAKGFGWL